MKLRRDKGKQGSEDEYKMSSLTIVNFQVNGNQRI